MDNPLNYSFKTFGAHATAADIVNAAVAKYGTVEKLVAEVRNGEGSKLPAHHVLVIAASIWEASPAARSQAALIALNTLAEIKDTDTRTAQVLLAAVDPANSVEAQKAVKRIEAAARARQTYYFQTKYQALDIRRLIDQLTKHTKPKVINEATRFICVGSCFASNIASSLLQRDVQDVVTFRYQDDADPLSVLSAIVEDAQFLEKIASGRDNVVILTAGFAETGRPDDPVGTGTLARFLTPEAVAKTIAGIAARLLAIDGSVRIFVTVSPVPLAGTASAHSPYEANAISKSIMRLGVEMARNIEPRIEYFPSYELVTQHFPAIGIAPSGASDGSPTHTSQGVIDFVTDLFLTLYVPSVDLSKQRKAVGLNIIHIPPRREKAKNS